MLGAVLLGGEQPLGVALAGLVVPAIGFTARAAALAFTSVSGEEPTSASPSSSSRKR